MAVLLPDGMSAAVFLLHDGSLHAVGNVDPFYRAPVMCHGIVGDRAGAPTVASRRPWRRPWGSRCSACGPGGA